MRMATRLRPIPVVVAAFAFVVTPLANPLLVALAAFTAGLLLAYRAVTDLLSSEHETIVGQTVFRHYI